MTPAPLNCERRPRSRRRKKRTQVRRIRVAREPRLAPPRAPRDVRARGRRRGLRLRAALQGAGGAALDRDDRRDGDALPAHVRRRLRRARGPRGFETVERDAPSSLRARGAFDSRRPVSRPSERRSCSTLQRWTLRVSSSRSTEQRQDQRVRFPAQARGRARRGGLVVRGAAARPPPARGPLRVCRRAAHVRAAAPKISSRENPSSAVVSVNHPRRRRGAAATPPPRKDPHGRPRGSRRDEGRFGSSDGGRRPCSHGGEANRSHAGEASTFAALVPTPEKRTRTLVSFSRRRSEHVRRPRSHAGEANTNACLVPTLEKRRQTNVVAGTSARPRASRRRRPSSPRRRPRSRGPCRRSPPRCRCPWPRSSAASRPARDPTASNFAKIPRGFSGPRPLHAAHAEHASSRRRDVR